MADLYNVSTRQPEQVPDNMVDQALADGTHEYPTGTPVSLKAPDGSYATIPSENIKYALSQGYKVFTPTMSAVDDAVSSNQNLAGTAKVFGSQFIDQLGLGIPELIYNKTQDPLAVAQYEAIKKDHEAANILGNTLGFAGSLYTGAPIFKGAAAIGDVAASQVASRLGVDLAGDVGTRTLGNMAKQIVAKTAGSSAEGMALFAPHAATEAVLGDPEQAGETLLSGLGTGALFGLGGQAAKGLLKLGSSGLEKASELLGEAPVTGQKIAQTGADLLTGNKGLGEMIPEYLANSDRINAAPSVEETKDLIDQHVAGFQQTIDDAKTAADVAGQQKDEAYKFALQDLRKETAPEDLSNQIFTDSAALKANIGDLSQQVDQKLADSGKEFYIGDLADEVGKLKDELRVSPDSGAPVGKESAAAFDELSKFQDSLQGLPKMLPAEEFRTLVRQVNENAGWGYAPGEFNSKADKIYKKIGNILNDSMKKVVPEVEPYLNEMKAKIEALKPINEHFSDPIRSQQNLTNLLNSTAKSKILRQSLEDFQNATGGNYISQLDKLKNAKDLLARSAVQDVSPELVPGLSERHQMATKAYEDAKSQYGDTIRRLGPNRTQSVVSRQGFKSASIEDKRALENLGSMTGEDFTQKIQDRHILDSFTKSSTNGSRKSTPGALLGGSLGGLLGGPAGYAVGTAIGGAAGMGLDVYSGKLLKTFLDHRPDISGLLFVEQQMKKTADKLDEIPGLLDKLTSKTPATPRGIAVDIAAQVMGQKEGDKKLSKSESLEKMRDAMAKMQANPALFQARLASLSSPITGGGAPNIGNAFNQKTSNAFNYLYGQLPKPPAPPSPFAPSIVYKPSDQEISNFMQKLQVVNNPLSVLDELKYGTLTKNHIDALQAVYPKMQGLIQQKVMKHVMDGKAKPMPYQNRLKLSMLMGAPMDSSMTPQAMAFYQNTFQIPDQTVDKSQQRSVDLSENAMTETQRIESKQG